jgi:hypothetical protein
MATTTKLKNATSTSRSTFSDIQKTLATHKVQMVRFSSKASCVLLLQIGGFKMRREQLPRLGIAHRFLLLALTGLFEVNYLKC